MRIIPKHAFPMSVSMLVRALKSLLWQVQPGAAAVTRVDRYHGPKSLQALKAEALARHRAARDAYINVLQEGHQNKAFGHLNAVLRQYDVLLALNTGAWSRIPSINAASLEAPSQSYTPTKAGSKSASISRCF